MNDPHGRRLQELTRGDCRAAAERGAMVVLPVGATEQHGPHLPIGTDTLQVEHVALEAATRTDGSPPVLVAPTLPFGCSPHHLPFGGTISLGSETLLRVLLDIGASLAASGFSRLFLLNGHGGNHQLVQVAARDIVLAHGIDVAAASWWHLAADALVAHGAATVGDVPGHAGAFETSLVLALRRDLVADELPVRDDTSTVTIGLRDPLTMELSGAWQAIDGWSDSPAQADATRGRDYLSIAADSLAAALARFAHAAGGPPLR